MLTLLSKMCMLAALCIWIFNFVLTANSTSYTIVDGNEVQCPVVANPASVGLQGVHTVNLYAVFQYSVLRWSYYASSMLTGLALLLCLIDDYRRRKSRM